MSRHSNLAEPSRTVIITGANSGLGYECAKRIALLSPEYHIVLAGRSSERMEKASRALVQETGVNRFTPMRLDLGSLASVRQFAELKFPEADVALVRGAQYCLDRSFYGASLAYPWGQCSPAVMSYYEYMRWPGIDMLMSHLLRTSNGDPLMLTVKEVQSAASQLGKERVLCEVYGAGGWDTSFEDMKRIGDWLAVNGITFFNQHLVFSSIVGARKRDHPLSFDWRQPWWADYRELNDYFSRLCLALSQGRTEHRVLVLHPTLSWFVRKPEDGKGNMMWEWEHVPGGSPFRSYVELLQLLSDNQIGYDLGDEFIMERHGSVAGDGRLRVGQCQYDVVIIPEAMNVMRRSTLELLNAYASRGGSLLLLGAPPNRIDGIHSAEAGGLTTAGEGCRTAARKELAALLRGIAPGIAVEALDGDGKGIGLLYKRLDDGKQLLFAVNSNAAAARIRLAPGSGRIRELDLFAGEAGPYKELAPECPGYEALLPAYGSLLLEFAAANGSGTPDRGTGGREAEEGVTINREVEEGVTGGREAMGGVKVHREAEEGAKGNSEAEDDAKVRREAENGVTGGNGGDSNDERAKLNSGDCRCAAAQPQERMEGRLRGRALSLHPDSVELLSDNVLMLDYCKLSLGGQTYAGLHTLAATDRIYKHHGLSANPWDRVIQFKDRTMRSNTFSRDSGFEASFAFDMEDGFLPSDCLLAVERADKYSLRVNGTELSWLPGRHWLDKRTGLADIAAALKPGRNLIQLTAAPFDIGLELEPVYLLGGFAVGSDGERFRLHRPQRLKIGSIAAQGCPFYGGRIRYDHRLTLGRKPAVGLLRLNGWSGTMCRVSVNGRHAGLLGVGTGTSLDIAALLHAGDNRIVAEVAASLKNTLGPHHDPSRPRGRAWPAHWKIAPQEGPPRADSYDVIDYGLLEPIAIELAD